MAWFPYTVGFDAGGSAITLPISMNEYLQVVVVGASLMEQATNTSARRTYINDQITPSGFISTVHEKANSGDDSAAILSKLQGGLLDPFIEVAGRTLVLFHGPGNDVSAGLPEETVNTNLRAIYQFIIDAGFTLIPSPISYRTAPTLDPSAPYNTNVVLPAITDLAPTWIPSGVPVFDMYKLTSDTPSYLVDGIHLTEAGKTAHADLMAMVVADNITPASLTATDYIKEIFINFGLIIPNAAGAIVTHDMTNNPATVSKNTDGSLITNATQVSVTNASNYATGRTNQAQNVAPGVLNNESLEAGVYVETGTMLIDLSQSGVDSSASYTVEISASRDTTDTNRVGEYTVGGTMQELDAALDPVEKIVFSGVSGADLIANGVNIAKKSGSTFAYIGSLLITKE